MLLTNVSAKGAGAAQAAKPEPFKGYTVGNDGKLVGGFFTRTSTLESLQKEYDGQKAAKKDGEEVALWKRPFVFLSTAASNLANMIANAFKAVFFCFFKAEENKEGEKAGEKKDTKVVVNK